MLIVTSQSLGLVALESVNRVRVSKTLDFVTKLRISQLDMSAFLTVLTI